MKDETLKQALECIEAWDRGCSHDDYWRDIEDAITAIKQALAAPVQELHKGLSDHLAQATNGRVYVDPVTGDVGIGTPAARSCPPCNEDCDQGRNCPARKDK